MRPRTYCTRTGTPYLRICGHDLLGTAALAVEKRRSFGVLGMGCTYVRPSYSNLGIPTYGSLEIRLVANLLVRVFVPTASYEYGGTRTSSG